MNVCFVNINKNIFGEKSPIYTGGKIDGGKTEVQFICGVKLMAAKK